MTFGHHFLHFDEDPEYHSLEFQVLGVPRPQGSKRPFRNKHTGKIHMVESSKHVGTWRGDVRTFAANALEAHEELSGAMEHEVHVHAEFTFRRPKKHYGTGKHTKHILRDDAPQWPDSRATGDLDKLLRAALDAITGILVADDSQVVALMATKRYVTAKEAPGMWMKVTGR